MGLIVSYVFSFLEKKPKALPNEFVQTELLANAAKETSPS